KTKFANDVRDLVEHFRRMPVDLGNHRTLDLVISQIFDEGLWCKESGFDIDKLGKCNIRTTMLGRDKTKKCVCDAINRSETNDGLLYFLPEIHLAGQSEYHNQTRPQIGQEAVSTQRWDLRRDFAAGPTP